MKIEENTGRKNHLAPGDALQPFRPGVDGPWDRAAAAHLVRRATFGMPEELVEKALEQGPVAAVNALFQESQELEDERFAGEAALQMASLEAAQGSWVYRMLLGGVPAREKLTLFWHGHFATSNRKVDDLHLMQKQIDLFRRKGAGSFEELLLGVARDPAMLLWLDCNSNRRGRPNENFARELMELFSLGIGNYTEEDIKEAARAFTGWHVRKRQYWFNQRAHDRGEKQVFQKTGPLGGEDLVHLCATRQACSEFIAGKLFEYYVLSDPSPDFVRELGKAYAECGQKTGRFLERLLSSRIFYSTRARRALVADPADFAVGSLRTLGATANTHQVARAMAAMGQDLLLPPSVKGWDRGQAWLSSGTLLARYRFTQQITLEETDGRGVQSRVPWEKLGTDFRGLLRLFFPEGLAAPLVEDLTRQAAGDPRMFVAGCLELPEYQFV